MELKNGSGVIKSFVMEENLIPQPCGRIISFEKDADMMKMYKEHEQATKSKRYSSNDGFREAAC
jgi:hypothetical protein